MDLRSYNLDLGTLIHDLHHQLDAFDSGDGHGSAGFDRFAVDRACRPCCVIDLDQSFWDGIVDRFDDDAGFADIAVGVGRLCLFTLMRFTSGRVITSASADTIANTISWIVRLSVKIEVMHPATAPIANQMETSWTVEASTIAMTTATTSQIMVA